MQTKKVRLYINGERQRDIRPNMTKWQIFLYKVKRFFKVLFWGIVLVCFLLGIYEFGNYYGDTKVIYTKQEVIKEVDSFPPVLKRIAKAESYDSHFCTKEIVIKKGCHSYEVGSVLMHINKNGTYDIGRYAINSIHLLEAKNLGFDVYKEKDNEQFAIYLFKNFGSEPWMSSSKNW